MTPAARVQAAIEMLDAIIEAARSNGPPADRLIADGFRQRRYAGSKDRRAIRELVYGAIRACGPVPANGRAALLRLAETDPSIRALFDGSSYGPAEIGPDEAPADGGIAPVWLEEALAASGIAGAEAEALLERAPLDIRINTLKASRENLTLPVEGEALAAPAAVRLPYGTRVEDWAEYAEGLVEIQDGGSQLVCLAMQASPGETVIDLCAGAGGKTLALAAAMHNTGQLIASDTDRNRLSRLAPRAERAGAVVSETVLLDPGKELRALAAWTNKADAVLVDAPCSGTGTWRRNPEARWRLTPEQLERYRNVQEHLLFVASSLAGPKGRITYITCSLLDAEGPERIETFLAANPGWVAQTPQLPAGRPCGAGIRLTPQQDGTDGFFVAQLGRA